MNRRQLADNIDALDEKIAELQREKAEFYSAYRENYTGAGHHKDDVKLELVAVKAAIRHRQHLAKDKEAVVEKGDRVDEIVLEISGTAVATRTRAAHELGRKEDRSSDTLGDLGHRSKSRLDESMRDSAIMSQKMATAGLISQEAADETKAIAAKVSQKLGHGKFDGELDDIPPFLDRRHEVAGA